MVGFKKLTALLAAALPLSTASPTPFEAKGTSTVAVEGKYIVSLKNHVAPRDAASHLEWVRGVHEQSLGRRDLNLAGVEKTFGVGSYNGYSGHFDAATIEKIKNNPDVDAIEPVQVYQLYSPVTQDSSTYGLATLSHRNKGASSYIYDESAGEGTYAYIVDSGINAEHEDFEDRAVKGYNAIGGAFEDNLGHGTHVAGTIGGKTYGVAKKATLVSVKVFEGRTADNSIIMDGYQWAVKDIVDKGIQKRAVVNMSLGGPKSDAFNRLVEAAYQSGVLSVVAAGNERQDTANVSPASAPNAITVGGIDVDWVEYTNSNYGKFVDIMAPAVKVESAYIGSDSATAQLTGTSMASPHVAGLAIYLAALENLNTPKAVTDRILALGTRGKATLRSNNPNIIAYNGNA
ncbi:hypothetical protein QQS21_002556 [Conoideocrella luteorostrata]|uniref:Uncharacterized protein n=1 Tax=Conoideocrella luteorostrata TaxID=1105319 RepID=A0AAJ0CVR8_9HYPO|nr:hypothetical protein QQS21_002556 [Conoideocrella luteorostrata]